jgi:hypothetical protein
MSEEQDEEWISKLLSKRQKPETYHPSEECSALGAWTICTKQYMQEVGKQDEWRQRSADKLAKVYEKMVELGESRHKQYLQRVLKSLGNGQLTLR